MTKTSLPRQESNTRTRRAAVRYRCEHATGRRVFVLESYRTFAAEVHDLSVGGVGLILAKPLPTGTLVFIDLFGFDVPLEFLARVAHANPHDDGRFLVGFQFDRPLNHEELTMVLAAYG